MLTVSLQLVGLVPPVPVPVLMAAVAAAFASIAIGNALWDTMLQQHVPQETISRVSSLDWMVSLVFMPLGYTAAGPLADRIGVEETLLLAAALGTVASLSLLLVPSIRNLRRLDETAPDEGAAEDVSSARTPLPV
jgi:MFS family permease